MDGISLLTIIVLAVFVGFEVVSKVSSTLHTPLMSGANAIHGIILVGAIIVAGQASDPWVLAIALLAVVLATANLVGGFVVTDRMLEMFSARQGGHDARARPARPAPARTREPATAGRRPVTSSTPNGPPCSTSWRPSASSSPSRASARRGPPAAATSSAPPARWSPSSPCSSRRGWRTSRWILGAIAVGSGVAAPVARRVKMTQMPQLVALFNGVGGGAAALVAVLELGHSETRGCAWPSSSPCWWAPCPSPAPRSRSRKLQELMTTRPVVFPGLPVVMGGRAAGGGRRRRARRPDRFAGLALVLLVLGLAAGRAAGAAGRRGGRADRHLAAERLHRPRGRRVRPGAGQRAAAGRGHAGGRERHHPDPGHGLGHGPQRGRHHVRRVQGRLDGGIDRA